MRLFKSIPALFCLVITTLFFADSLSAQALMGRVVNLSKQAVQFASVELVHLPDSQVIRSYSDL
jgi:hypothetical protein